MTVNDLIDRLECLRDEGFGDSEVRVAYQPSYPMSVAITGDTAESNGTVFIGTSEGNEYLNREAAQGLGWK